MPTTIQFFAPEYQADPFPTYSRMREEALSRIEPGGFYAISRHADVLAALRNPTIYSSTGFVQAFEPPWVGYNPGAHTMLSHDPPEHTRLRALVNRAFVQSVLERTTPLIQGLVDGAVKNLAERGEADIVADVATPITAGTIGHFLTLDPALHAKFKAWSDALASVTPTPMGPEHEAIVHNAIRELTEYLSSVIHERRRAPGDDMVSLLVTAEIGGERLSDKDVVAFLVLLMVAGLETTVHLIAKSMIILGDRPELVDRLRADESMIPRFIEEMLRYDPPTHSLFRFVMVDTEVGGEKIPAGSVVMLMLGAANRDGARFPRPDEFDMERDTQGSIAFGYGAHACIGMALARLEAKLTLTALLRRFRRFERIDSAITWNHTFTVRGPKTLHMRALP
jgi:cytochrome P450